MAEGDNVESTEKQNGQVSVWNNCYVGWGGEDSGYMQWHNLLQMQILKVLDCGILIELFDKNLIVENIRNSRLVNKILKFTWKFFYT